MRIHLDKIGSEPFEWQQERTVPVERLDRTELLDLSPIEWAGQVRSEDSDFRLEARLAYRQTVACDRCLAPIEQPIESDVQMWLVRDAPAPTDEEIELSTEDLETLYVDGDELELDVILIEQLQLNIPMRALCKEDCRGLCPICGANRNLESCECVEDEVDPRWETLRQLKETE